MIISGELTKKDITYWAIFLVYIFAITFYLITFTRAVGQEVVLTSLDVAGVQNMKENKTVVFNTNLGVIKLELFVEESPITAGNFLKLVEDGFYDGTRFHRVIGNFMIQGGDPLSKDKEMQARWGTGDPGYAIEDEFIDELSNVRGTISMANSGPNSGGSQFFINLVDNLNLDWDKGDPRSKHPVFGKVISGMDVVDKIGSVATEGPDRPIEDVVIEKITIE